LYGRGGGHAEALLEKLIPDGKLIGIDRDDEAIRAASERLARFKDSVVLRRGISGISAIF